MKQPENAKNLASFLFFSFLISLFSAIGLFIFNAFAEKYTSPNYEIWDPVLDIGGGYSTSTTYSVLQSFGQFMLGTTTSGTYSMQSGFLAFPVATSPVLSASGAALSANLNWTASQGFVGWSISGYDLGNSLVSGGPYSYENVGNVLNFNKSGLTGGATYYFRVRAKDNFGNPVALSNEASAVVSGATPTPVPTSPPGGGGGPFLEETQVIFRGKAYPLARVILLKDGSIAFETIADTEANFEIKQNKLNPGNYVFGLYAYDSSGRASRVVPFFVKIEQNKKFVFSDILIPPTLDADKSSVKEGEGITIFGQTAPGAQVALFFTPKSRFNVVTADSSGKYVFFLSTAGMDAGKYSVYAWSHVSSMTSQMSYPADFSVTAKETVIIPPERPKCPPKGDFNNDCRVNIVDFSIMMYWFVLNNPPEIIDMNGDGKADLFDLSIMVYWWTG